MSPTTVPISMPSQECPHCGQSYTPGEEQCPHCQHPLTTAPLANYDDKPLTVSAEDQPTPAFGPQTAIILEFAPSMICMTLEFHHDKLFLGRALDSDQDDVLDLTEFKGHRRGVSRRHAVLRRYRDRLTIADLGSTNGTFLNGERLQAREEHVIEHGAHLVLGEMLITVYFVGQEE